MQLKDLRPARYNPRTISDRRLAELGKSYEQFGDLSGVVFNRRTQTLVSGHQRVKSVSGKKTKIETKKFTDEHGTVEMGFIRVQTKKRGVISIPLRVVDWDSKKTEMAANIAANAHGGDWDSEKLSVVLAKLQKGKFDLELTGLDPLTLRSLRLPDVDEKLGKNNAAERNKFKDLSPDTMEIQHECPKCHYKW